MSKELRIEFVETEISNINFIRRGRDQLRRISKTLLWV